MGLLLRPAKVFGPVGCPAEFLQSAIRKSVLVMQCMLNLKNFSKAKYFITQVSSLSAVECRIKPCSKSVKVRSSETIFNPSLLLP